MAFDAAFGVHLWHLHRRMQHLELDVDLEAVAALVDDLGEVIE